MKLTDADKRFLARHQKQIEADVWKTDILVIFGVLIILGVLAGFLTDWGV